MKNLYFSFVIAGSSKNSNFEQWELESNHRPRFGRNWWFWVPYFNNNGGKFRKGLTTDVSLNFLCFSVGVTWYR